MASNPSSIVLSVAVALMVLNTAYYLLQRQTKKLNAVKRRARAPARR